MVSSGHDVGPGGMAVGKRMRGALHALSGEPPTHDDRERVSERLPAMRPAAGRLAVGVSQESGIPARGPITVPVDIRLWNDLRRGSCGTGVRLPSTA